MALLFMDGFAHYGVGDLSIKYDSVKNLNTIAMGAAYGRYGGCGIKLNSTDTITKFVSQGRKYIISFAVKATSFAAVVTPVSIFGVHAPSGPVATVRLSGSGSLFWSGGLSPATSISSSTPLIDGQWAYLEARVNTSTSYSSGDIELYMNGSLVATWPSGSSPTSWSTFAAVCSQVKLGSDSTTPAGFSLTFADLVIRNWVDSSDNGYWGDKTIQTLYPASNGSRVDFAATGAASLYGAVGETPADGDSSYIASAAVGNKSTFMFGSLSGTPATIKGVQTNVWARKNGAGTRVISPVVTVSGTDYLATATGLSDSYRDVASVFETNPGTSAAWGYAEINSLEAGVKISA